MISQQRREDDLEFTGAVEVLTRFRLHQGGSALQRAVKEAARLSLRFCGRCGSETSWEGSVCVGCGLKQVGPRERLNGK